jgi:hypothetical protein
LLKHIWRAFVRHSNGHALAYVYFEKESGRRMKARGSATLNGMIEGRGSGPQVAFRLVEPRASRPEIPHPTAHVAPTA